MTPGCGRHKNLNESDKGIGKSGLAVKNGVEVARLKQDFHEHHSGFVELPGGRFRPTALLALLFSLVKLCILHSWLRSRAPDLRDGAGGI